LILSSSFRSQTDSLIKQLPKLKGEKKVKTLCDISYYLSATNPEKGQHFGRLALKEARRLKNKSLILQSLNFVHLDIYFIIRDKLINTFRIEPLQLLGKLELGP
jgi:hypothetical protein